MKYSIIVRRFKGEPHEIVDINTLPSYKMLVRFIADRYNVSLGEAVTIVDRYIDAIWLEKDYSDLMKQYKEVVEFLKSITEEKPWKVVVAEVVHHSVKVKRVIRQHLEHHKASADVFDLKWDDSWPPTWSEKEIDEAVKPNAVCAALDGDMLVIVDTQTQRGRSYIVVHVEDIGVFLDEEEAYKSIAELLQKKFGKVKIHEIESNDAEKLRKTVEKIVGICSTSRRE